MLPKPFGFVQTTDPYFEHLHDQFADSQSPNLGSRQGSDLEIRAASPLLLFAYPYTTV